LTQWKHFARVAHVNPKIQDRNLELPTQTGMLVRMDNTITVPVTSASNAALAGSSR